MNFVLVDTNVVSFLFKPDHRLHSSCAAAVSGLELCVSFMSRAELTLWPAQNRWGTDRISRLRKLLNSLTTLFPDEETCDLWAEVTSRGNSIGRPIASADAWIAATALQWKLPLITTDHRDFAHVRGLTVAPVS